MRLELKYRNQTETIIIPDQNLLGIIPPNPYPARSYPLDKSWMECAQQMRDFLSLSRRIVVIVNDYTRPTLTRAILQLLEPELKQRDTKYLVGLGTHRNATKSELEKIFGSEFYHRHHNRIIQHNGKDEAQLFFLGRTRFGTEVWINRALLWAEKVITINSVEPHYFAGYTGGRKSFIPAVAGFRTIIQNHGLLLHPASAPFSLKDNPVHLDMSEATRMIPRAVFSLQLVQNHEDKVISLWYGDLFASFKSACDDAWRAFAVRLKQPADIVVSILLPPYDINFYQSQRAVEFARQALKPGGIHITVSACYDGAGNDEFIKLLQTCSSPEELLKTKPPPTLGWHKAARLARIMQQHRLYTVMPGVKPELISSVFMQPFSSIQQALDTAFAKLGTNAQVYIFPDAGSVVPIVNH